MAYRYTTSTPYKEEPEWSSIPGNFPKHWEDCASNWMYIYWNELPDVNPMLEHIPDDGAILPVPDPDAGCCTGLLSLAYSMGLSSYVNVINSASRN